MDKNQVKKIISPSELGIDPIAKAHTIPSQWYTSPQVFELEQQYLFKKNWQYVCHADQISAAGSSYCSRIAQNPVIVFKDSEDQIRCFYNVCKHRGGPLAIKKGTKTVLQCQYHGWTYLDDGSLRGVPDWNKVDLFDTKDFGLDPIPFELWHGLIFVKLNEASPSLNQLLGGIPEAIAPLSLSNMEFHSEQVYDIHCNWKVYVDNFLEGYHIPIVHPELAKLLDYRAYTTETAEWYSLQHSPFKKGENMYSSKGGQAFYYFVYPNIMLNILPGRLQVNSVIPVSADQCKVVFSYFYEDAASRTKSGLIQEDIDYSHQIQLEDIEICEAVQHGLASDAYHKGRFSVKREVGVYHFQNLLKKEYRDVLNQL